MGLAMISGGRSIAKGGEGTVTTQLHSRTRSVRRDSDPDGAHEATHSTVRLVRGATATLRLLNHGIRAVASSTHHLQAVIEGRFDHDQLWCDHYADLYWKLPREGDAMFLERGMFNRMILRPDADLLEIACGDGFFTRNFYGSSCRTVLATDVDPRAIAVARRNNRNNPAANIRYEVHDVRNGLPQGSFTHVIWDGAMAFLTQEDLDRAIGSIHDRVGPSGFFSGYWPVEQLDKSFVRYRLASSDDVAAVLGRHFEHILILTTPHPERTNYYFLATDSILAFAPEARADTAFTSNSSVADALCAFADAPMHMQFTNVDVREFAGRSE